MKNKLLCVIFFLLTGAIPGELLSQNILDYDHSLTFCNWLLHERQYHEYQKELKRLVAQFPDKEEPKQKLIRYYSYFHMPDSALSVYQQQYSLAEISAKGYMPQYVQLQIFSGKSKEVTPLLNADTLLPDFVKNELKLSLALAHTKGKETAVLADSMLLLPKFYALRQELEKPIKSPLKAVLLSIVLPGAGKVYSGRWHDGLMSFAFVTLFASQAYIGFHKRGTESVYGYLNGGMALGFYCGTIYGSFKAARLHNHQRNEKIHDLHYSVYKSDL